MTEKRFDVVYEEDDEYKNIRYWEIIDTQSQNSTSNEIKICDLLNEQHKENITLNNQLNNFKLHSKDLESENQLLKKALRELLESDGNTYMIDLMDKIFDLNYREWYNPTGHNSEDYVDWEEELQLKELRDLYD